MKFKIVLVILICAIATLSFTSFTSKTDDSKKVVSVENTQDKSSEPAGGLSLEDKF